MEELIEKLRIELLKDDCSVTMEIYQKVLELKKMDQKQIIKYYNQLIFENRHINLITNYNLLRFKKNHINNFLIDVIQDKYKIGRI